MFALFVPETRLPVGSYKSSAFGAGSLSVVAASGASFVHPLAEVIDSSVDGGVLEGVVPWGGTGFKILARRAGAPWVIRAERALSTGLAVQGRQMDHEARVLPAKGGARFGGYAAPMTTQAVSTTPAGTVGR
ncbi:hypothetical protein [Streptomyces sp. NPDC058412]|uniref:hypothetical protein n=1 Tax=Streptomyces sp. NPDC058412 TaxID=3346486 RepID=UPI00365178A4